MGKEVVYVWGYLPGVFPLGSSVLTPVAAPSTESTYKDVCAGGCGFALAVSGNGNICTWGTAEFLHQRCPSSDINSLFGSAIQNASAGWAHCVACTENGEIYNWGWSGCLASKKICNDSSLTQSLQKEATDPLDDTMPLYSLPYVVNITSGIKIIKVSAGDCHTLALSDTGHVWGWGCGDSGQLGLGSQLCMVSSPHLIPCIEMQYEEYMASDGCLHNAVGRYVTAVACGGRHSVVLTDTGAVLTFGWGLYGQCGHGSTEDELAPACVTSLLGIRVEAIAAGLWHTLCVSAEGDVYAFGGNQHGQLGTGREESETLPCLLDAPCLESVCAITVSCGSRHSSLMTDAGEVFCWGWNKFGQLGLGDTLDRNTPTCTTIEGHFTKSMVCGRWHTLIIAQPSVEL